MAMRLLLIFVRFLMTRQIDPPSNKGQCIFVYASLLMYYMRLSGYASLLAIVIFHMRLCQLLFCVFVFLPYCITCVFWAMRLSNASFVNAGRVAPFDDLLFEGVAVLVVSGLFEEYLFSKLHRRLPPALPGSPLLRSLAIDANPIPVGVLCY